MKNIFDKINSLISISNIGDFNDINLIIKCHKNIIDFINDKKYNIEINLVNQYITKLLMAKKCNCIDKQCKLCKKYATYSSIINFIVYRNKLIINYALDKLDNNKLFNKIKKNCNYDIDDDIIKKSIKKLLNEFIYEINGNWDTIICNSKGITKKINIINPLYLDRIDINIKKFMLKNNDI